ncbi:hypothetical protein V5O48_007063, partial [Marasmius crinis-equi]
LSFPDRYRDKNARLPGSLDTRKAPWVLGQVCRSWRLLSLSTPDLWTRIDVSWKHAPKTFHTDRIQSLETVFLHQLERCGKQPLTISYRSSSRPSSDRLLQEDLLLHLYAQSSQWKHVSLKVDVVSLIPLNHNSGRFPSLQTLHVNVLDGDWTLLGGDAFRTLDDLPSLESFSMSGDTVTGVLERASQLSWKQIIRYASLETSRWYPDVEQYHQILPKLENLQTCVLDTAVSDPQGPPLQLTLHMHFLHTLVLVQPDPYKLDGVEPLLKLLALPALRVLRLPSVFNCPKTLVEFLDRSCCFLEELIILDMRHDTLHAVDDFIRILNVCSLQDLHTLGLGGVFPDSPDLRRSMLDSIFRALTFEETSEQVMLPVLRRLGIHGPGGLWMDVVLIEMLASRRRPVENRGSCQLEKLMFRNFGERSSNPLEKGLADRVVELCEDGLYCSTMWGEIDWYIIEDCDLEVGKQGSIVLG